MKYILFRGMEKVEVEADSVGLVLDNGDVFELQYRKSDGEVSLNVSGRLNIIPVAANVVRIRSTR